MRLGIGDQLNSAGPVYPKRGWLSARAGLDGGWAGGSLPEFSLGSRHVLKHPKGEAVSFI